ncbi:MAG: DHH family phosphoesterase [Candidatus Bathyarchaeota archaeon]|nr:DHH family phosphoesterase [Candidatus Bathyarchaeota archaeon]
MLENQYKSFISKTVDATKLINEGLEKNLRILIVSHFDADGIAAAAILSKALYRKDALFHVKIIKRLNENIISDLSKINSDLFIFSDIGAGYLSNISKIIGEKKAIILDHHQLEPTQQPKNILHVNPHLFELDGANEISGSGISYLVSKSIDTNNVDLSPLGVVGALGDIQDKGEKHSLFGLNNIIVEDSINSGNIKVETDLIFFGRETRPMHKAIAYTTNPFLPGLSGKEDRCFALLNSAQIPSKDGDKWRSLADLTQEEKQRLLSKIIEHISSLGFSGNIAADLVGKVYTLVKEEKMTPSRNAREFAALLNACGRMERHSLALAFCLGERDLIMDEIQDILNEYRRILANYMDLLTKSKERIDDNDKLLVIHGEDIINENMTGALSTILLMSNQNTEKVILVLSKTEDGNIKISGRASRLILQKGANLGKIMQTLAEKFSGMGGGHDVAAGAEISPQVKLAFLEEFKNLLLNQIGSN